jgi:hypothetical protein
MAEEPDVPAPTNPTQRRQLPLKDYDRAPASALERAERERGKLAEIEGRYIERLVDPETGDEVLRANSRAKDLERELAGATRAHKETVRLRRAQTVQRRRDLKNLASWAREPRGYYPRVMATLLDDDPAQMALEAEARREGWGPATKVAGDFRRHRQNRERIDLMPEGRAAQYADNTPAAMYRRLRHSGEAIAMSQFHEGLAALGRPLNNLSELRDDAIGSVFIKERNGFKPVWNKSFVPGAADADSLKKRIQRAIDSDQEVVYIPRDTYRTAMDHIRRGDRGMTDELAGFDKLQGRWKTLATVVNPGYHGRNMIGDSWNARLGGATTGDASAALRMLSRDWQVDRSARNLDNSLGDRAHLGEGDSEFYRGLEGMPGFESGHATDADVLDWAREYGVTSGGFAGNELRALNQVAHGENKRAKFWNGAMNLNERREEIMRLASFRAALKQGMDLDDAARHVSDHHFDYGNLTPTEAGVWRRLFPFYTFASRNAKLQAKSLVKSPGRFATLDKVRDAAAEEAGLPEDWAEAMPPYLQRQLPIATPLKGKGGLPTAAQTYIPATDLNLALAPFAPGNLRDEGISRMSPILKTITEQALRFNTQYGYSYDDPNVDRRKPAPTWAKAAGLAGPDVRDDRSGKMVPGWHWRTDLLSRQVPWANYAVNRFTPGRTEHATGKFADIAQLAGPRIREIDADSAEVSQALERSRNLERQREDIKDSHLRPKDGTWGGKVKKLNREIGDLRDQATEAQKRQGYDHAIFERAKKGSRQKRRPMLTGRGTSGLSGRGNGGRLR